MLERQAGVRSVIPKEGDFALGSFGISVGVQVCSVMYDSMQPHGL